MKNLTYILSAIALGLVVYNLTQVDFDDLFSDKNTVALITIMAGLCAILLLTILRVSKNIETKVKKRG